MNKEQMHAACEFDSEGNLLWAGGTAEKPWIVSTYNAGILNKDWVGGKSAKQADIFRKLNGLDSHMSPKAQEIINSLKNQPLHVIAENQFAVTDYAYQLFIAPLLPELRKFLDRNILDLQNNESFSTAEKNCQDLIRKVEFSTEFVEAVHVAFEWLDKKNPNVPRAVRSTAPSEDGGEFSGSGKYSTKLRQFGFEEVLNAIKACFISRFNRGALHYQFSAPHAFGEDLASLSFAVMVQDMQPSIDVAGTIFTADTQSNHPGFVEINFTYGLGEAVVSGRVSSDSWIFAKRPLRLKKDGLIDFKLGEKQEYFDGEWHKNTPENSAKKCMSNETASTLSTIGMLLGDLFRELDAESVESDLEAAINFKTNTIIITQQRAITTLKHEPVHRKFTLDGLNEDGQENATLESALLLKSKGINAGIPSITHGVVISLFGEGAEFKRDFEKKFNEKKKQIIDKYGDKIGVILVTAMTYPWMEPSMEQTVACITTRGGKNDHTPIWCKEHGLPCAVSVKGAPEFLKDGNLITYYGVGDTPAFYEGRHQYSVTETQLEGLKPSPIPIRLIVSDASTARSVCMRSYFPSLNIGRGSGLVRWEMLAAKLRVHPMAVMNYSTLENDFLQLVGQGRMTKEEAVKTAESVAEFIRTESSELSPVEWYVKALAREIAGIVSPYYTDDINEPMVVRLPDFKTNEHADLLGGRAYEPVEENPMLGDRGAGKYLGAYQKAFLAIDLKALAYVINDMGYTNIHIEVPFVRTPDEMKEVARLVKESGINIPLQMMFELPVNISRATEFFKVSDGGQIGSNDLLQLEFGLDRSGGDILPWHIQHLQSRIENLIQERNTTKPEFHLGLCGNLPSTNPEFAKWLVDAGIDEFSVTPDALIPALLGVTGETPDGKQNITVYTAEGEVFVNGQKA